MEVQSMVNVLQNFKEETKKILEDGVSYYNKNEIEKLETKIKRKKRIFKE